MYKIGAELYNISRPRADDLYNFRFREPASGAARDRISRRRHLDDKLPGMTESEHYGRMGITEKDVITEIIAGLGDGPLLRDATDLCVTRLGSNDASVEVGGQTFVVIVEEARPQASRD